MGTDEANQIVGKWFDTQVKPVVDEMPLEHIIHTSGSLKEIGARIDLSQVVLPAYPNASVTIEIKDLPDDTVHLLVGRPKCHFKIRERAGGIVQLKCVICGTTREFANWEIRAMTMIPEELARLIQREREDTARAITTIVGNMIMTEEQARQYFEDNRLYGRKASDWGTDEIVHMDDFSIDEKYHDLFVESPPAITAQTPFTKIKTVQI